MTVGIECQIAAVAFLRDLLANPRPLSREQIEEQRGFLAEVIASLRSLHPRINPHYEHPISFRALEKKKRKKK